MQNKKLEEELDMKKIYQKYYQKNISRHRLFNSQFDSRN